MECTLHTRVSGHPNIVKLAGVVEDDTWLYLILEWWTGGDLFDALVELSSDMKYPVSSDTQSLMYALSNPVDALEIFLKLVDAVDVRKKGYSFLV